MNQKCLLVYCQVHISHVGQMRFKGVAEVQNVMQFSTAHLAARQFPTAPPSAKADLVSELCCIHLGLMHMRHPLAISISVRNDASSCMDLQTLNAVGLTLQYIMYMPALRSHVGVSWQRVHKHCSVVAQVAPGQGLQYIVMMKESVSPQWPGSGQI